MHVEKACGIGSRSSPSRNHLNNFSLLLWSELRTAAANAPLLASAFQTRLGTFTKHSALELSKRTKHLHHHTPGRACGINRFAQASESGLRVRYLLHDRQDIPKRTRKPIELPHYQHIALSELVEKSLKFGTIPTAARGLLAKDPLTSCRFQRRDLCCCILFVR
jgi:hypothetical protein